MPTRFALATLLSSLEASVYGDAETAVTGIAYDSRKVEAGDVFVAVPGFVHDGLKFVPDAIEAGAVAVVTEADLEKAGLPALPRAWARVADARAALAPMAATFYAHPSRELTVVGVTGTNGKTTVTSLVEALLAARGPAGRWSTTAASIAGVSRPAHRTTPEAPDLQRALRQMVDAGCWAAALEVSSHALTLQRADCIDFDAAVFTNLSGDHLDFHADLNDYLEAKAMLFDRLGGGAVAVLNVDDPGSARLAARTPARVVGYGWKDRPLSTSQLRALIHRVDSAASSRTKVVLPEPAPELDVPIYRILGWGNRGGSNSILRLETPGGDELRVESPLFGPANAENLAAALAVGIELGLEPDEISAPIAAFRGAPGRFQRLMHGQPFAVLVDYAHTPDALQAALAASRSLAGAHRVIVVFGCGGDRDTGKRPQMGRIAALAADQVMITSDNPRSEDPEAIIDEIAAGIPETTSAQVERFVDRREAVENALQRARPGDCVLIAGKGHEREQVFADRVVPFDDAEVAGSWLRARFDVPIGHDSSAGAS